MDENGRMVKEASNPWTPIVLLLGMSVHGLFEAIAIGLLDEMTPLVNLTIAVCIHKWAVGFSLV